MSQINEQKCPACGAPLRFDPASGKLVCDYCLTVVDLPQETAKPIKKPSQAKTSKGKKEGSPAQSPDAGQAGSGAAQTVSGTAQVQAGAAQAKPGAAPAQTSTGEAQAGTAQAKPSAAQAQHPEEVIEGFDFATLTDAAVDPAAMDLPVYNCVSCGAEVIAPPEQMALTCPYCGNNIVLTDKITGKLRPDGVIPFRIQAKDLPEAVNRFYKDKKLLPRRFFSEKTMGKVTGVYVPFWVFNGRVFGEMYFKAQTSATSRSGDYIITKTNHYRLAREAAMDFANLPVDASARIEDRLMDSLEPFDTNDTRPFDMRFLAGFTADRFDQKKEDMAGRAKKRMLSTASSIVNAQAASGYGAVSQDGSRLNAQLDAKYILFPVYMFDISHAGKSYHFAVNGQTGKVVGDVPTDSTVSLFYMLKRTAIVSGALIAFSIARYMLGM